MVTQLSSKFQLFGKSNPCPVCQSDDDRCKTPRDSELILCMTHRSSGNGFRFVGESKDAQWGKFYPGDSKDEFTPEQKRQWKEEQAQKRQKIEEERVANCLSAVERDRLYTKLLSQFALHPDDKADLLNRGISEDAIKQAGFVSVGKYQRLNQKYPTNLPGVGQDGRSLVIASEGYLCPVRDANGLIVALQIRVRNAAPNTGKYRWVSSESRHRLKNGEMPLAHYGADEANDKKWVALIEGTGAKPLICSQRLNCLTLGAAGGQFFNAESQIKDAIALGLQPILVPDAGAKKWNEEHQRWNIDVLRRYERLRAIAPNLKVLWWGQIAKSVGDVDEISDELLNQATVISFEEYMTLHSDANVKLATINPKDIEAIIEAYEQVPTDPGFELEPLPKNPGDEYEEIETTIYQKVLKHLYSSKPWICVAGKLYEWRKNHYRHVPDATHTAKISRYLSNFHVTKVVNKAGDTVTSTPYASPNYNGRSLSWVKSYFALAEDKVNPAGLNCVNGVLRIVWSKDGKPSVEFSQHNPNRDYFLYEPYAVYSPDADGSQCDRMMECLSDQDQDTFFKIVGASLDIENVLKHVKSRIPAVLCLGKGSNGKDVLRNVVSMMFGHSGMTNATFNDFYSYDQGRKFSLSKLKNKRFSWSSENSKNITLDLLQSLKASITLDNISFERKGIDEEEGSPKAVYFFNINEAPSMTGSLEAIKSRFCALNFNRTFKARPDEKKGEKLADPRFKHDHKFLQVHVLPGFLVRVLKGLRDLIDEGISYSQDIIDDMKRESRHLLRFAESVGVEYSEGDSVPLGDIWDKLEDWYLSEGLAERDQNGKLTLHNNTKSDPIVKSAGNLFTRLMDIFPGISRKRKASGIEIMNLRFYDPIERERELTEQQKQLAELQQNEKPVSNRQTDTFLPHTYTNADGASIPAIANTCTTVDINDTAIDINDTKHNNEVKQSVNVQPKTTVIEAPKAEVAVQAKSKAAKVAEAKPDATAIAREKGFEIGQRVRIDLTGFDKASIKDLAIDGVTHNRVAVIADLEINEFMWESAQKAEVFVTLDCEDNGDRIGGHINWLRHI